MNDPAIPFSILRDAFSLDAVSDVPARIERLRALSAALDARREEIVATVSRDFGHRSPLETGMAEIAFTRDGIRHLIRRLPRWSRPRRSFVLRPLPGRSEVRREPKGVVGVMSPWNYPVQLALLPLATAIAAGNRALLKPSERTPATAQYLAELVKEVFPPEEAAVVTGDADTARAFSSLPFDHLFFTGSTQTGRLVAAAAGENLTPVTLELGGKSPCIALPDADPAIHAALIGWGKWFSAGQTCVAPDYLLVPKGSASRWAEALLDVARGFLADPADYTAIIDPAHHERLEGLLAEGGEVRAATTDLPGRLGPAIVLNPPQSGRLMTEEIFGPILPIVEYGTIEEAIAMVAGKTAPLALYVFGRDSAAARKLVGRIRSGGAAVNGTILQLAVHNLPFGGIGTSGMGAYHGDRGLMEFSHERALLTVTQGPWTRLLVPPYSGTVRRILTRLSR
ncbi:aldehyde dehydrogenase family protein [Roseovarius sp. S4756]|uniref:aldehyde dehydrogenase family protein n=1 Tax=Roseovarius maritimus TaxID=3342637 RepID=UPI003729F9ED